MVLCWVVDARPSVLIVIESLVPSVHRHSCKQKLIQSQQWQWTCNFAKKDHLIYHASEMRVYVEEWIAQYNKREMDKRVYEFLIFQDKALIYYIDPQQFEKEVNYEELQNSHRIRNLQSTSATMSHFIRILHPNIKTQAKNFKTKEYQLSLLETANGLKLVLVTSVLFDSSPEQALNRLYEGYLNLVKRNYLYRSGELVKVVRFEQQVRKILKSLQEKQNK